MTRLSSLRDPLLAGLLALGFITAAAAQATVYRCGPQADRYSQVPCPEGRAIQVGDARSAAAREQALALAQREQAWAQRLRADRLAQERMAKASQPAGIRMPAARDEARQPLDSARGLPRHPRPGHDSAAAGRQAADPRVTFQIKLSAPPKAKAPVSREAKARRMKPPGAPG